MLAAIGLARRGLGRTSPNPSVGAIVVDPATGEIIARARTANGGRPHAEPVALALAGPRARGATLYVTLEPCSHLGRTPPCADAVIAAGIARVVVGGVDPDPRVAGRGLARLRAAGIEVVENLPAAVRDAAREVTLGHILRVCERRPFVELKMALRAADGSVPRGHEGVPLMVSNLASRAHAHILRARADAILVGAGTLRDDNPELTCRLPGMADRSPRRIVLSRRADVALSAKVVRTAREVPTIVAHGPDAERQRLAGLAAAGVETLGVGVVDGRLWLPAVLEGLAARGVTRLLVEGGPAVWRAFLSHSLADRMTVILAGATAAVGEPRLFTLLAPYGVSRDFALAGARPSGDNDFIFELRRAAA